MRLMFFHVFRAFKFKSILGTFANAFQRTWTYPGFVDLAQIICFKKIAVLVIISPVRIYSPS